MCHSSVDANAAAAADDDDVDVLGLVSSTLYRS